MATARARGEKPVSQVVRDWMGYIPTSVGPAFLAVIASMVFTRMFLPKVYGVYTLAIAMAAPLVSVVTQLLSQPVGRFYLEYQAAQQLPLLFTAISKLLAWSVGLIGAAELVVVGWMVLQHHGHLSVIIAVMIYVVLQIVIFVMQKFLLASFRSHLYRYFVLVLSALGLALPLVLIFTLGHDISFLIWGNVLGSMLVLASIGWAVRAKGQFHAMAAQAPVAQVQGAVRRFLRYGFPFAPWFLADAMLLWDDRYILFLFHGIAAIAVYSVSYTLAQQGIGLLISPFLSASWPRIMQRWKEGSREETQQLIGQLTTIYLLVAGLFVGLLFEMGHPLLTILVGKAYVSGYKIIGIVALGSVLWKLSSLGQKSMELVERTSLMMWDALFAALVGIVFSLLWIPRYGITGAALSSTVAYVAYTVLIWIQCRRILPWRISPRILLVVGGSCVLSMGVTHEFLSGGHSPVVLLISRTMLYGAVYLGLIGIILRRDIPRIGYGSKSQDA